MYAHAYKASKSHVWPLLHVPLSVVYILCVPNIPREKCRCNMVGEVPWWDPGQTLPSNALQAELSSLPCAYMLAAWQMDVDA